MIHMGLSMLTIALEVSADSIGKYDTLLEMIKDDLCKNLFAVNYRSIHLEIVHRLTKKRKSAQILLLLFLIAAAQH